MLAPMSSALSIAAAAIIVLAAQLACGGADAPAKRKSVGRPGQATPKPPTVEAKPVEFAVQATRVGSAVHLEVTGTGRGHHEGGEFEDPETWSVRCFMGDEELERVVNGSARVERSPVGSIQQNRWDVTVVYQVGFALPRRAANVDVEVSAPGAKRFRDSVELAGDEDADEGGWGERRSPSKGNVDEDAMGNSSAGSR